MILKFYKNNDGIDTTNVLECNHYEIVQFKNRIDVIVFRDYFTKDGVTYQITSSEYDLQGNSYRVCFVENNVGKTINIIRI